jgi:hypothetical protein
VRIKSIALILIVAFAAVATSIVINLSSSQTVEENVDFDESYNTLQMNDDEVGVELLAELDTPGMPG